MYVFFFFELKLHKLFATIYHKTIIFFVIRIISNNSMFGISKENKKNDADRFNFTLWKIVTNTNSSSV